MFNLSCFSQAGDQFFNESKELTDKQDFDKALLKIDKALELDSLNRNYIMQKIKVLYYKSDCENSFILMSRLVLKEKKFDDETMFFSCLISDCLKQSEEATEGLMHYVNSKKYVNNEMLVLLAQRLYNSKKYDECIYYYNEYLKLEPKDVNVIIDFSRIIYAYKGSEEGINVVVKGLDRLPNNMDLLKCLVAYYHTSMAYDKAIEIQNQIIEINNDIKNIETRAKLYELIGKPSKAYDDYKTILTLRKCATEYYLKILQYEFDNKHFKEVVEHSFELIKCDKSYENSIIDGLYTSLFFCDDFEKGKFYLEKRIMQNADNFNAFYLKILVLFKDKQYEDILKYIDLARKSKDINDTHLSNINLLKFSYFLVKQDYDGLSSFWKSGEIKSLNNNLNFTLTEESNIDNVEVKSEFEKNGIIKTTLMIPTKVLKLLIDNYKLKIETSNK